MANDTGIAPNAKRILWAGFMAILAEGVGFGVRGGILGDWGKQFGFTLSDLGEITGGGLTGFGIIILFSALIADYIGYGRLMIFAFIMHALSAVVTLAAAFALPFATWFTTKHDVGLTLVMTAIGALAILKHRKNIQRLLNGTENRIQFKKKEATP